MEYKKNSLRAFLAALGLCVISNAYASTITKHGECIDDINVPGFIIPVSPAAKKQEPVQKKEEKSNVRVQVELPKSATEQVKVSVSTMPYTSEGNTAKIGLFYPSVSNTAKTSVYDYTSKGSGFGIIFSLDDIKLGKNWSTSMSIKAAQEYLKTVSNLTNTEVGKITNDRKDLEWIVGKKIGYSNISGGIVSLNDAASEEYAGITADSNIRLFGMKYGIDWSIPGTKGVLKLKCNGSALSDNGSSDIESITSSGYGIAIGPVSVDYNSNSFNSTNPGIQQAYQQGIFPTEMGITVGSKKNHVALKTMRGYELSDKAYGIEGAVNLSQNLNASLVYTQVDRESKNKVSGSDRTTFTMTYEFGGEK